VSNEASYPELAAHDIFEQRAVALPERPALLCASRQVSYGELARLSARRARALGADGVGPGSAVGLYARSSVEAIVAILAVFKAGGIVVPLDPALPSERIAFMIHDSGATPIVTTSDLAANLTRPVATHLVDLEEPYDQNAEPPSRAPVSLDDPSFVLYTSGSTGRPKGVVRRHRAIVSRLAWASPLPHDVFCHNMSLNVGFSQERLFLPLMSGLPLALIPEDDWHNPFRVVDALERFAVTQVTLVPDTLRQLLALGPEVAARLLRLRSVAVGSAPLTPDLSAAFYERWPLADLVNAYGSTESGSIIRGIVPRFVTTSTVPIGRPVPGSFALVLSPDLEVVPDGEVGELCVGGPSLALGYLGLPDLENDRFIRHPLGPPAPERMYRTGDRARCLADGSIEVLGRLDRQVKIRGARVELAEIEAVLARHDAVAEAIVTKRGLGDKLVAYVVWRQGRQASESALADYLAKQLPAVMLPAAFVVLDCLPKTPNAKVDVSLLPAPPTRARREIPYVAPHTDTEQQLAAIWRTLLSVEQVGRDDTFLDMGGDSLATTELLIEVQRIWSIELPLRCVLDGPGLAAMALAIDELVAAGPTALTAIPRSKSADDAWSVPSIVQQERLRFERWSDARSLPYAQAQIRFLLELDGPLSVPALNEALNSVIAAHDSFGATFPLGEALGVTLVRHRQPVPVTLDVIPIDTSNEHEAEMLVNQHVQHLVAKPFDYNSAPLLDAALMRLAPERHRLLLVVSHLVADALSLQIVQEDLIAAYEMANRSSGILDGRARTRAPLSYADFADWQSTRLDEIDAFAENWGPHFAQFERFSLAGVPPARSDEHDLGAASFEVEMSPWDRDRLATAAAERRVTPYMVLLAAFAMRLRAASGVDDVAVMLHFANRRHPETRRLVGWLANSFPVGLHLSKEQSFDDLLDEVRRLVTAIDRHQHLPLPAVARVVHDQLRARGLPSPDRPPSPPWPRVSFEMLPAISVSTGALTVRSRSVSPDRTEWGLRLLIRDPVDDPTTPLSVRAVYSTTLFEEADVRSLLLGFRDLIVRVPDWPVLRASDTSVV
jgi:amino acid adenylation domain-containing protein